VGTRPFPGVKRPGRGADYSPPTSAELRRVQSYNSASPLCLQGVSRDDLYLYIIQSTKFSERYNIFTYYFVTEGCPVFTGIVSKTPCTGNRITSLHDRPLLFCCPDALSPVGDPLSGNGCGSPNHI